MNNNNTKSNELENTKDIRPLTTSIMSWIENHKKISRLNCKVEDVTVIVDAIYAINALDEHDFQCGGENINDIELPKWCAPFIVPAKVSLELHEEAADLVVRPEKNPDFKWNQARIAAAATRIASSLRTEAHFSKVTSMRQERTVLSNINYSIGDAVPYFKDNYFVPIPIDKSLGKWLNTLSAISPSQLFQKYMTITFSMDVN